MVPFSARLGLPLVLAGVTFGVVAHGWRPAWADTGAITWARLDSVRAEPGQFLGNPGLDLDPRGETRLVVSVFGDSSLRFTRGWRAFDWNGRDFARRGDLATGGALRPPDPVVHADPSSTPTLLWLSHDPDSVGRGRILAAAGTRLHRAVIDTIAPALLQSSGLCGAVGPERSWIARSEQRFPVDKTYAVRVWTRARAPGGRWFELPSLGVDEFTCAASPLGNDSVLVVYAGASGLGWSIGGSRGWGRSGFLDARPWRAAHPRLALTDDGRTWLLWTSKEWIHVARFDAPTREWDLRDSLRSVHPGGGTYWSAWCAIAVGAGERPVLAWSDRGFGHTNRDVLCVALPVTGGGWVTSEVPGSEGALLPTIARDRRGRVWVAWSRPDRAGVYYALPRTGAP